jgi:protoporphyrinogen/coproporphyrinogen III oxidase
MTDVVVVGGGITGLTAAWRLSQHPDAPRVTLLEASDRLGGKILGTPFAGLPNVEAGPDMFLARVPWALDLCGELGITDLVSPATGKAYVYWDGELHPIPEGVVLGAPTDMLKLSRSRLLSWRGKARAAIEPVLPRHDPHDDLGALIRGRFGAEVLERLVDPLVGGINAGDASRLSLAASAPQIGEAARRSRSLLLGLRGTRPVPGGPPAFYTPAGGLQQIVDGLVGGLHGVDVRLSEPVEQIARADGRYRVGSVDADAVVVAVPAFAAATLLEELAPAAASIARSIPYAGVVMVTMAVDDGAVAPLDGSGHLVPKPAQRHVTASSWASTKWAHYRRPGQHIIRASLGRFGDEHALELDDESVVDAALSDLRDQIGLRRDPTHVRVTRWPRSFPQHLPGHLDRVTALERSLPAGVVVAGAAYRGIGIPACIRQGTEAAAAVYNHVLVE